jgi:hypothetical protein
VFHCHYSSRSRPLDPSLERQPSLLSRENMLQHTVMWKLKEGLTDDKKKELLAALYTLKEIEGFGRVSFVLPFVSLLLPRPALVFSQSVS